MNAGELKHIIRLLRPTVETSATGAQKTTYTESGDIRAKLVYGKGYRSVVNDEIFYGKSVYFTVRIYVDVNNTDIVLYNGEKYRILAIEKDEVGQSKEITAELINE